MRGATHLKRGAALGLTFVTTLAPLSPAHAVAACTTSQSSYVGNGTNGSNGVSYTTLSKD